MTPILLLSTLFLFLLALGGGLSSKLVSNLSPKWMDFANAVSGGVVVSVALVHMLGEASEGLEEWGLALGAFFTGYSDDHEDELAGNETADPARRLHGDDEPPMLPLGSMLMFAGFFAILLVEQFCGGHMHEVHREPDAVEPGSSDDDSDSNEEAGAMKKEKVEVVQKSEVVTAVSVLSGIFVHSFLEGLAAGVAATPIIFFAIMVHKSFAAFAVGSALLPAVELKWWWAGNIFFALSGTVGIFLGEGLAEALEGPATEALICFAAGTLLCVGVCDMIVPAISGGGEWGKRKVIASFLAAWIVAAVSLWA
jgi:zinc transporter ZupT